MTPKQKAVAAGEKTYYTGKPCKRGHAVGRYVSDSSCTECAIGRAQKRYSGRPELARAYSRDRYWKDPDKYRADVAARRVTHPETVLAEKRAEYERNKARYLERATKWRQNNPEKAREIGRNWCANHPDQSYGYVVLRRMAKLRRTPTWLAKADRDIMAGTYRKARKLTASTGTAHHVDHVVPLRGKSVSGLHVPWNLQILTANQNQSKGNRLTA